MNRRKLSDAIRPTHRPLIGTEARFIRLQPNSQADPIRCDLVYLPPTDVPCYVALSYVWGDPKVTQEIYLNDSSFQVTTNLFSALQQLRAFLVDPSNAPKVFQNEDVLFWVDALCIDQSDLEERVAQVPRMSQIYGSADLVVAWLGDNGIHDEMVGMITAIAKVPTSLCLDTLLKNERRRFINAFRHLLSRQWFRRVWVVQEVVLARRHPVYLADSHWCGMKNLGTLWWKVYDSGISHSIKRSLDQGNQLGTYVLMRESMNKMWTRVEELIMEESEQVKKTYERNVSTATEDDYLTASLPYPIIEMLRNEKRDLSKPLEVEIIAFFLNHAMKRIPEPLETTIPHDQVYGLLSLAKVTEIPKELKPDYTTPFPTVFHTYAKVILQHEQDLSILSRRHNRLNGVPSWVPDFRSARVHFSPRQVMGSVVEIVDDGKVCITEGVRLGEVTLATVYRPGKDVSQTQIRQECLYAFETFLQDVCKVQKLERKKTLEVCLSNWFSIPTPSRVEKLRQFYVCAVSGFQHPSPPSGEQYDRAIADDFLSKLLDESLILTSSEILARVTRLDESAKEGDILSIMKGSRHPFLLRPTAVEGEYTFIGACHIFFGNSKVGATKEYFAASKVQKFRLV